MVDGRIILHHFVRQRSVMRSLARASLIHIARLPFQSCCIVIRNVKDMSHQYCNRQSSWGSLSLGGSSTCWNWRPASPVQPVLWPPRSPSPPGKPERDPSVEAMIKDTQLLRKHRGKHRNHKKHQKTKTKKGFGAIPAAPLHHHSAWERFDSYTECRYRKFFLWDSLPCLRLITLRICVNSRGAWHHCHRRKGLCLDLWPKIRDAKICKI